MKTSKGAVQAKIKDIQKEREREKIARWKICKGKPPSNMRYIRSKMYMSTVLNLNKKSCFQLLSNVALNAYYKQHNHKGKTLHENTKNG